MRTFLLITVSALALAFAARRFFAQEESGQVRQYLVPESSREMPGEAGQKAHTNHVIVSGPLATAVSPQGETPASLACIYASVSPSAQGCPQAATQVPSGGWGAIAVVDAFDYPTAEYDLGVFSAQFSLPACTQANGCLKIVYAGKKKPRPNCGWAQEAALDLQWAHAMAPSARLFLVEADSNSLSDLMAAVDLAGSLVSPLGGQVSMSWGSSEFPGETKYDAHFNASHVVYFAASGDVGGKATYPGVSPLVVSCGGTTLHRGTDGGFLSETGWSASGGGPSQYESRPAYQNIIQSLVAGKRGTPDLSFDADPQTGVSVYDSTSCQGQSGWMVFGGTSVSAPSLAGLVNLAHGSAVSTSQELQLVYANLGTANFRDIVSGTAGANTAGPGWDFVTGVGSVQGLAGK